MRLSAREWGLFAAPVLVLVVGCWLRQPEDQLAPRLQQLAGPGATDCGRGDFLEKESSDTAPRACMERSFRNHQPCFVRYDVDTSHSLLGGEEDAIGFASTSEGKVLMVVYHATRVLGVLKQATQVEPGSAPAMLRNAPEITDGSYEN